MLEALFKAARIIRATDAWSAMPRTSWAVRAGDVVFSKLGAACVERPMTGFRRRKIHW
jgi:hypothetical protein